LTQRLNHVSVAIVKNDEGIYAADRNSVAVRKELEVLYRRNADAFHRYDSAVIMALRAADAG